MFESCLCRPQTSTTSMFYLSISQRQPSASSSSLQNDWNSLLSDAVEFRTQLRFSGMPIWSRVCMRLIALFCELVLGRSGNGRHLLIKLTCFRAQEIQPLHKASVAMCKTQVNRCFHSITGALHRHQQDKKMCNGLKEPTVFLNRNAHLCFPFSEALQTIACNFFISMTCRTTAKNKSSQN